MTVDHRPEFDATARAWLDGLAGAGFLPGVRAAALDRLRELLCGLVAEPYEPGRGFAAGRRLVAERLGGPGALGVTVRVLSARLPALLGDRDRLPELLGD